MMQWKKDPNPLAENVPTGSNKCVGHRSGAHWAFRNGGVSIAYISHARRHCSAHYLLLASRCGDLHLALCNFHERVLVVRVRVLCHPNLAVHCSIYTEKHTQGHDWFFLEAYEQARQQGSGRQTFARLRIAALGDFTAFQPFFSLSGKEQARGVGFAFLGAPPTRKILLRNSHRAAKQVLRTHSVEFNITCEQHSSCLEPLQGTHIHLLWRVRPRASPFRREYTSDAHGAVILVS